MGLAADLELQNIQYFHVKSLLGDTNRICVGDSGNIVRQP